MAFLVLIALLIGPAALPAQTVDPELFDAVLRKHVVRGGIDYAAVKKDRAGLDTYVAQLGTVTEQTFSAWKRAEQIAFLLNAYNALVVQQVIDHYPITRSANPTALVRPANSVWQINGFFNKLTHRLLGRDMTLDQIEHEWLRAKLKEPRIHFALVCAARSCPPLRTEAYRGDRLDVQLDEQARAFLNDRERNRFSNDRAELSEIFKWFGDDFGGERGLRTYLARYLNPALAARINSRNFKIGYIDYDWELNDVSR
jgi:uncharacterized protein YheU (UPF0270 family)